MSNCEDNNTVVKTKRYIHGKRKFMNSYKRSGLDYEDRSGKKISAKIFKRFERFCCKKKCSDKLIVAVQKQIFDDFYKLGDPIAQDQVLMDNIQIYEKARSTSINKKTQLTRTHDRQITVRYYLKINATATEVCKSMFQNVLDEK